MIFAGTDLRQFLRFVFCRIREKSDVEIDAVPRVFFPYTAWLECRTQMGIERITHSQSTSYAYA